MSTRYDDYLWDPRSTPDTDVERFEQMLQPLSAEALGLAERELPLARHKLSPRLRRRMLRFAAVAASLLLFVFAAHIYRLSWRDGSPWPAVIVRADGTTYAQALHVGQRIATNDGESATLQAARIGTVAVGPSSIATLVRARKGQHRIELERGRLHAKIWAPPSYFGVTHGDLRFTDLGCEFDLNVEDGNGTLVVASGWVVYRHGDEEILVPAGYSLGFAAKNAQVPLRVGAAAAFRQHVIELDTASADFAFESTKVAPLAQSIAAEALDDDFFTLLNLLVRHPQLAETPLYPRLARALHVEVDASHRARWAKGDVDAREEWWRRLPAQPKTWWLNWRDMF